MNIEIRHNKTDLLKKICKETETNPSQLMELIIDLLQSLYSDMRDRRIQGLRKDLLKNS